MATRMLRRGLPRVPGGDPWPPADAAVEIPDADVASAAAADAAPSGAGASSAAETAGASAPAAAPDGASAASSTPSAADPAGMHADAAAASTAADAAGMREAEASSVTGAATNAAVGVSVGSSAEQAVDADAGAASAASGGPGSAGAAVRIRRGLPRVAGGEPWPPAALAPAGADVAAAPVEASHARGGAPEAANASGAAPAAVVAAQGGASAPAAAAAQGAASTPGVTSASAGVSSAQGVASSQGAAAVRRGLPRTPGGEPWPPAGTVPVVVSARVAGAPSNEPTAAAEVVPEGGAAPAAFAPAAATDHPAPAATVAPAATAAGAAPTAATDHPAPAATATTAAPAAGAVVSAADIAAPLPWTRTVWNGRAPRHVTAAVEPTRRRPTWTQAIAVLFGAAALGVVAGAAVAFVRALLSFPFMQDFLAAFPGEYEPAIAVEPGFAPWIGWQHFFNMFLMVLIIRSGLQVRTEKRPTVFWAPRHNPKGKISLALWFHQSLDILWLVNGVIFVVLLFVTGHWVRIVPTSGEVFPNALSAALQYVSFDWPHENGWNNYNSLQQLAYFATVFIAAPLAAITGFRMSGLWPKRAERLSKAYPVEWARALHFPIMLYFVAFIIAHVALVMLTGFLRNLNHMFASQDAVTWTGFWVFVLSLVVIAIGWVAARPLVLAPIAKAFGKVSGR